MNKILNKKNTLMDWLDYINIIEKEGLQVIAGLETYINYEGEEVKKAMHVIIYKKSSKEIIHETGNVMRLEIDFLTKHIEKLLELLIEYNYDMRHIKNTVNDFFLNCNYWKVELKLKNLKTYKKEEQQKNLRKKIEKMTYKEKFQLHLNNTIKYFDEYTNPYKNIFENKDLKKLSLEEGKKLINKLQLSEDDFFKKWEQFKMLNVLKQIDVNNILYNFKKYCITGDSLKNKAIYTRFTDNELYDIKDYLYNDSEKNMSTLKEQNEVMANYPHFDMSMKRIETI